MRTNQQPSMPPKIVQQIKESTNQVIGQLREAENIYIEAVEAIAMAWEPLIDDETVEQLVEQEWQENLQVIEVKAEIKKLPTKEKIAKGAKLKQL